jgi:hypothetical protein
VTARDVIADLEKLVEDNANAYDDWWAARGVTTVRRRYRDERDAAQPTLRAQSQGVSND